MICTVHQKDTEEIHATNILTQTSFWARIKNKQGYIPNGYQLDISQEVIAPEGSVAAKKKDDLLVLVRYLNRHQCFAYVPYGPKTEPDPENHGLFLEELSEVLRSHLPSNCICIKYDLPWQSQWATEDTYFDDSGNWCGPPPLSTQELRLNFKTKNWNLQKSPSDILPVNTIFINLTRSDDELLGRMKPKTRYNIRYSHRRGVIVKEYGPEMLNEWYRLYSETATRNNLTLHTEDYFTSLMTSTSNRSNDVRISLLMAEFEGVFLSAMFLALSRKRATYLYGASSSEMRNLMATYAIQWEAIRRARNHGCTEYDMFGTAPNANSSHPLHGLYRYKRGFGGALYHRMGCWDYPLRIDDYKLLKAQEINNQSYHSANQTTPASQ